MRAGARPGEAALPAPLPLPPVPGPLLNPRCCLPGVSRICPHPHHFHGHHLVLPPLSPHHVPASALDPQILSLLCPQGSHLTQRKPHVFTYQDSWALRGLFPQSHAPSSLRFTEDPVHDTLSQLRKSGDWACVHSPPPTLTNAHLPAHTHSCMHTHTPTPACPLSHAMPTCVAQSCSSSARARISSDTPISSRCSR